MYTVELQKMVERMHLTNLTPEIDLTGRVISTPEINRPALQLAGFFSDFDPNRVQLIGNVEYAYMYHNEMNSEQRHICFSRLMGYGVPCIIFCRNLPVSDGMKKLALEKGVPLFGCAMETTALVADLVRWLQVELAPRISIHGVLVDVFGEGVLITGESGIGKSEAALELIKRGHRLVSDDVVEIKKVSDETLVGSAPDVTRHLIELRGIGIIDVKTLYGVQSVKDTQSINLVIRLEEWDREKDYDRFGLEDEYTSIMDVKLPRITLPVKPGRNLAIIIEVAARNYSLKQLGYSAAQELDRRTNEMIQQRLNGQL